MVASLRGSVCDRGGAAGTPTQMRGVTARRAAARYVPLARERAREDLLTYLLTCYLTHVAHHYRIYTVP